MKPICAVRTPQEQADIWCGFGPGDDREKGSNLRTMEEIAAEIKKLIAEGAPFLAKCIEDAASKIPQGLQRHVTPASVSEALKILSRRRPLDLPSYWRVPPRVPHARQHTHAIPGNSWHQWGQAVDCDWVIGRRLEHSEAKRVNCVNGYHVYGQEAGLLGLTWGGLWHSPHDAPHVQYRAEHSPLRAGYTLPAINAEMEKRFG